MTDHPAAGKTFVQRRTSGHSDAVIVCRLVSSRQPGDVITHDELRNALAEDYGGDVSDSKVRSACRRGGLRLLREQARALHAVPGVGYRIAPAADHRVLSRGRQRRADAQLKRGLALLKHVRWDEMSDNDRKAHEAQLVIMSGLYENQQAFERRLQRAESAIQRIITSGTAPAT